MKDEREPKRYTLTVKLIINMICQIVTNEPLMSGMQVDKLDRLTLSKEEREIEDLKRKQA